MKIFKILLTALFALFSTSIYAQDETFAGNPCGGGANSGTWTVPAGVTTITVEICGAGGGAGGGGGGSNNGFFNTRGGGGGGAGAYSSITINVTPGSIFNYSGGAGGCGGDNGSDAQSGDNGSAGGNSTFSGTDADGNPVNLQLSGGGGGTGGSGTNGSAGSGGSAGTASGGCDNAGTSGSNGSGEVGGIGASGVGPCGGAGGASDGGNASNYGGGGGGGENSDGGNGAPGVINITFNPTSASIPTPVISTTPATTTSNGEATITNYDPSYTYTFTPAGPTVGAGGVISGMTPGTNYTVVASDGNCNSLPTSPFSIEPQITGPDAPIVTTDPATCFSDGTATITNYDANFIYTFTPAGPTVGAGGVISGLTPNTNYTLIATDGNGNDSPASNSFSVDPATSGTSIVFNPDPGPYCIDDSNPVALNATPTGGTYSGPGVSGTDFIPSDANIGTNTITYTYDDGSGCVDDESVDIEVVDLPTVSFSGLNGPYCADDASAVALTGQPAGGTFSGPGISGSDFIPEDAGAGNHSISYEFTDGNGCSNTEDNTVEVVDLPNVSAGNDAFICDGEATQLNASGATDYSWSPTTGLSDPNVADPTVNIASEETYVVTGTDANGCVNTDTVTVGVGTNPTAEFEAESACAGTPITFTNNSTPTGLNYSWDFGNGNTSNAENPSETYSSGGDFDVQLIVDNEGCTDTATQTLTVFDQPTADFTAFPLRAIANEEEVLFDNLSEDGSIWSWNFGDGSSLNGSFEPAHTYTEPGVYSPTLIASGDNGCTDTLTIEEYIEVIERSNFFVPNAFSPNGDGVNDVFEVFGEGIREYYIRIHDRWGELVFASDDITETWDGTNKGNILPPDVYVYYIKVSFEDLTQKTYKGSLHLLK